MQYNLRAAASHPRAACPPRSRPTIVPTRYLSHPSAASRRPSLPGACDASLQQWILSDIPLGHGVLARVALLLRHCRCGVPASTSRAPSRSLKLSSSHRSLTCLSAGACRMAGGWLTCPDSGQLLHVAMRETNVGHRTASGLTKPVVDRCSAHAWLVFMLHLSVAK